MLLFRQKMKNLDLPPRPATLTLDMERAPRSVSVRRIDEAHCNPPRLWQQMGCPQTLTREEVAHLIEESAMREEVWPFTANGNRVQAAFELGVNDVYFVTFHR